MEELIKYCDKMILSGKEMTEGVKDKELIKFFYGKEIAFKQMKKFVQNYNKEYKENLM